jgi:hypothetical protein
MNDELKRLNDVNRELALLVTAAECCNDRLASLLKQYREMTTALNTIADQQQGR